MQRCTSLPGMPGCPAPPAAGAPCRPWWGWGSCVGEWAHMHRWASPRRQVPAVAPASGCPRLAVQHTATTTGGTAHCHHHHHRYPTQPSSLEVVQGFVDAAGAVLSGQVDAVVNVCVCPVAQLAVRVGNHAAVHAWRAGRARPRGHASAGQGRRGSMAASLRAARAGRRGVQTHGTAQQGTAHRAHLAPQTAPHHCRCRRTPWCPPLASPPGSPAAAKRGAVWALQSPHTPACMRVQHEGIAVLPRPRLSSPGLPTRTCFSRKESALPLEAREGRMSTSTPPLHETTIQMKEM